MSKEMRPWAGDDRCRRSRWRSLICSSFGRRHGCSRGLCSSCRSRCLAWAQGRARSRATADGKWKVWESRGVNASTERKENRAETRCHCCSLHARIRSTTSGPCWSCPCVGDEPASRRGSAAPAAVGGFPAAGGCFLAGAIAQGNPGSKMRCARSKTRYNRLRRRQNRAMRRRTVSVESLSAVEDQKCTGCKKSQKNRSKH